MHGLTADVGARRADMSAGHSHDVTGHVCSCECVYKHPCAIVGAHSHVMTVAPRAVTMRIRLPDIFICMTGNPEWDVYSVYFAKVRALLDLIVNKKTFGEVLAFEYYHHCQIRGLPQTHILIKLVSPHTRLECVDAMIQAEIPSPIDWPVQHAVVTKFMMHAPCAGNPSAICRRFNDGHCMYRFPQRLQPATTVSVNGTVMHRRRGENEVDHHGLIYSDTYVHPYSLELLLQIDSHVSVLMAMRGNRAKIARYFYQSSLRTRSTNARHFYNIVATRQRSLRIFPAAKPNVTTEGQPVVTLHTHPQGLANVQFSNCVVKIRVGIDLERLTALGTAGPVELWNLSKPFECCQTLLPIFLFVKYLSRMSTLDGPAD
jgi:hypothetical protein